jgi:hypothetical protein
MEPWRSISSGEKLSRELRRQGNECIGGGGRGLRGENEGDDPTLYFIFKYFLDI